VRRGHARAVLAAKNDNKEGARAVGMSAAASSAMRWLNNIAAAAAAKTCWCGALWRRRSGAKLAMGRRRTEITSSIFTGYNIWRSHNLPSISRKESNGWRKTSARRAVKEAKKKRYAPLSRRGCIFVGILWWTSRRTGVWRTGPVRVVTSVAVGMMTPCALRLIFAAACRQAATSVRHRAKKRAWLTAERHRFKGSSERNGEGISVKEKSDAGRKS
jgi:hypothetical protein